MKFRPLPSPQVVGGGGVSNSDVLCGTLTGEHLYVESEPASCCNELVFQLGSTGFGGQAVANRQWEIKVSRSFKALQKRQFAVRYTTL